MGTAVDDLPEGFVIQGSDDLPEGFTVQTGGATGKVGRGATGRIDGQSWPEALKRAPGIAARGFTSSVAGMADLLYNAPTMFSDVTQAQPGKTPFVSPVSDAVNKIMGMAGAPTPRTTGEDYLSAGAAGAVPVGPGSVLPGVVSTLTSESARQAGWPEWMQVGAGLAAGMGFGTAQTIAKGPPVRDNAADLMLRNRQATASVTDEQVQTALRSDYRGAMQPFEADYSSLNNLDRPTFTPPPQVNAVEWGMPIQQAPQTAPVSTAAVSAVRTKEANKIVGNGLEGVLNRIDKMDGSTIAGLDERRSVLLSEARAPNITQDSRRILNSLAGAAQDDIDNSLLVGAAKQVREMRANYKENVIGPYDRVRRSGALDIGTDASEAWKNLRTAGREDIGRLADKSSPQTADLIRKRTVGEIIAAEEDFSNPLSGGSGFPVWRSLTKQGMDQFFTKEEWQGLRRLSSSQAFFKNPFVRSTLSLLGFGQAGVAGTATALGGDWLATSVGGRQFLARVSKLPAKPSTAQTNQLIVELGTIQAGQQTANAIQPE